MIRRAVCIPALGKRFFHDSRCGWAGPAWQIGNKIDMLKIIGIDPGLADTGVGVIAGTGMRVVNYSYGSIHTTKACSLPARLNTIYTKLRELLEIEKPDLMVVEDVFSLDKYPHSGITLGKVTGVILLAGSQMGLPAMPAPANSNSSGRSARF